MSEFIRSFGEGIEDAEREARFAELALGMRSAPGKLEVLFNHRFAGERGPGPIGGGLHKVVHAQALDVATELSHALAKLVDDWWSVAMLLSPISEDIGEVITRARSDLRTEAIQPLFQGIATALDELVKVLELRRFTVNGPASPHALWADEGAEKAFAEGTRFGWGGNVSIRSWSLRTRAVDGPGQVVALIQRMSLAVDAITSWIAENRHGIDELPATPESAAPLVEAASAPQHAPSDVVSPAADGAADPALAHVEDAAEFESTLAEHAPTNGERKLVQLIQPPHIEQVEHILRRKKAQRKVAD